MISLQEGTFDNLPKLGNISPDKIFSADDLPIPFLPINPVTNPYLGIGNRYNLNAFNPNL